LNTKVANKTAEQDSKKEDKENKAGTEKGSKKEDKENKAGAEKDDPSVIYKVLDLSKG